MERRIEGTFLHAENLVRDALDVQGNAPTMHSAWLQAFQNQQSQSALQIVTFRLAHRRVPIDVYRRLTPFRGSVKATMQNFSNFAIFLCGFLGFEYVKRRTPIFSVRRGLLDPDAAG
jgi:hypothetical protein